MIETYCLFDEVNYFVPESCFKTIDPVIYLNHSAEPNIISINDGEEFEALTDIYPGQELLVNYTDLAEGLEDYNKQQSLAIRRNERVARFEAAHTASANPFHSLAGNSISLPPSPSNSVARS